MTTSESESLLRRAIEQQVFEEGLGQIIDRVLDLQASGDHEAAGHAWAIAGDMMRHGFKLGYIDPERLHGAVEHVFAVQFHTAVEAADLATNALVELKVTR